MASKIDVNSVLSGGNPGFSFIKTYPLNTNKETVIIHQFVAEHAKRSMEFREILLVERTAGGEEVAYVVDRLTGELLDASRYRAEPPTRPRRPDDPLFTETAPFYSRNASRLARQKKEQDRRDRWCELRKLQSIADIKSKEDLEAVLGDHSFYGPALDERATLLVAYNDQLSAKASKLIYLLVAEKLQARNYAIVTLQEIKDLIKDRSGNYGLYLRELEQEGLIRLKILSKSERFIAVHPLCGFKGSESMRFAALRLWYKSWGAIAGRYTYKVGVMAAKRL
jgi:hypothetical protein